MAASAHCPLYAGRRPPRCWSWPCSMATRRRPSVLPKAVAAVHEAVSPPAPCRPSSDFAWPERSVDRCQPGWRKLNTSWSRRPHRRNAPPSAQISDLPGSGEPLNKESPALAPTCLSKHRCRAIGGQMRGDRQTPDRNARNSGRFAVPRQWRPQTTLRRPPRTALCAPSRPAVGSGDRLRSRRVSLQV